MILDAFRQELNITEVPVIVGGLADFLTSGMYGSYFTQYPKVNQALLNFAHAYPDCYYVTAAGLTANADGIHIDAASLRIFGVRYYEAFSGRKNVFLPPEGENDTLEKIYGKPLTAGEQKGLLDIKFSVGDLSQEEYQKALALINK